jgi:hypothetical protein
LLLNGKAFDGPANMSKRERIYLMIGVAVILAIPLAGVLERRFVSSGRMMPTPAEYKEQLSHVRIDDGIDATEAKAITQLYIHEYIWDYVRGCGALDPLVLRDGKWSAEFRTGYAGRPSDIVVQVGASTGAVSSSVGPAFRTFREFSDNLVETARRR